jgi:hypothetical protein
VPGVSQRNFLGENAAEILRVPLVIKYPERVRSARRVSDVNAETIDIVPTIADVLSVELTWPVDGSSLLDPARPERPTKVVFSGGTGRRRDLDAGGPDVGPALRRKLALFGDGARNVHRAPRLPPYDALIGRRVDDLQVAGGGGAVEITYAWEYDDVNPNDEEAVVFDVAGRFAEVRPDAVVALAVNGVVEAVTRTWEANPRGWLATPRFDAWRPGKNALDVFVVERSGDGVVLRRTSVGQVRPPDLNLERLGRRAVGVLSTRGAGRRDVLPVDARSSRTVQPVHPRGATRGRCRRGDGARRPSEGPEDRGERLHAVRGRGGARLVGDSAPRPVCRGG